jgi:phage gp29-like protein
MAQATPPLWQFLDIPVLTDWRSTDSIETLRAIMEEHERGMFHRSSVLADEMLTDDRIAAVMGTRIGGLLCAPLTFEPADDRKKSGKLAKILGGVDSTHDDGEWVRMCNFETQKTLLKWHALLGFAVAEKVWVTDGGKWTPRLLPWHPRYCRYNWGTRTFQLSASGTAPGSIPVPFEQAYNIDLPRTDTHPHGDGKWFVWGAPYSWMNGLIRALGQKYVDRQWNERDWSRYCEKHGLAIMEGKVPSGTSNEEKDRFEQDLANIGNEPTIITPQAPQGEPSYGFQMHEATARTWETYKARKEALDTDIAVLVLGQNLTTEVKGGSFSATQVHEGIRADKKAEDAQLFTQEREQLLVPWAEYNFGDGEIAPYPQPQIEPPEDEEKESNSLKLLGEACKALLDAFPGVDVRAILEAHGIPIDEEALAKAEAAAEEAAKNPPPAPPVPGAPPAPGEKPDEKPDEKPAPADPTAAALSTLAMLKAAKAGGPVSLKRVGKYHDALVARARKNAAKALAPDLEAIRDELTAAKDPADLKRRLVARFKHLKGASELAALLERVNILGHATGRGDVLGSL